jgi:threonine dehydratase
LEEENMKIHEVKDEVLQAEARIRNHIRETPAEFSPYLSQIGSCSVHLKLENFQISGSFKYRGAANKLLSLTEDEKKRGITTASSGNHGAAVACLLQKLGCNGTIYLPKNVSPAKIEALRLYNAHLESFGDDCVKAEMKAKRIAQEKNLTFVSPYNDPKIIGGQGTVAVELERQIRTIDAVLVPVGGGGLISGIGAYLKSVDPKINIIGCQPENSCVMAESLRAGRILDIPSQPTLSDGTAGGIEQGSITFDICRDVVDDFILVTEEEIKQAIRLILEKHHLLIEGGAALTVASFLKTKQRFKNKEIALIITGSKISLTQLREILNESEERHGTHFLQKSD